MRGNNPGNLRRWGCNPVVGGFVVFKTLYAGTVAMRDELRLYGTRRLNTIQLIVNTWAPGKDHNNVSAYISGVTSISGFSEHQVLDLTCPWQIGRLMNGMIKVEQGQYLDETLLRLVCEMSPTDSLTGPVPVSLPPKQVPIFAVVTRGTNAPTAPATETMAQAASQPTADALNEAELAYLARPPVAL